MSLFILIHYIESRRRLRVKKRLFFICSQKTPIKQMITIREGCEGGELNFIGTLVIFNTISSKLHGF